MKYLICTLLLFFTPSLFAETAPAPPPATNTTTDTQSEHPSWFKNSFLDLPDDVKEATDHNKRILLYFYQDGCPYCAKLNRDNFGNPDLAKKIQQHFDVIALNMWGAREVTDLTGTVLTEKSLATSLKVQYTPTLLFLDEQGKVALRINGYYNPDQFNYALDYVAGKHEKESNFREYLEKKAPNPQKAVTTTPFQTLAGTLTPPLKLQDTLKANGRHLLLIIEQEDCSTSCQELIATLQRPEVAYSLTNLDVAWIKANDTTLIQTPSGKNIPITDWIKDINIKYNPSLLFFDSEGNLVFEVEAYLKAFHIHGALDYVASSAYKTQPEFQRFLQQRREALLARGIKVDLMD
ncbi:thioredoxin family protein [Thiofilum flexile]|uniref:thioredoxin family protein n=1 Tax=Thiofilum flexile TaxID=125627 RepID=UPI000367ABE1|nr:thioredoxin family protein [Thiofilum flexile]